MTGPLVGVGAIERAAAALAPVLRSTPTYASGSLGAMCGRPVLLKPEHRQRTGSFKIRGAFTFIAGLPPGVPVVAGSAGNHAQGVALAASLLGHPARVFMPERASLPKLAATRGYGAAVETVAGTVDDCLLAARAAADAGDGVFVPAFDDPRVIAGQGSLGLEIAAEAPQADVVLVPVGGGGLIAGVATALRARMPGVRIVGVQAARAAAMARSLAAGHRVEVTPRTMADGVALRMPGELTFRHVRELVDTVVTVSEEQISRAVLALLEREKSVVEPSGALGVAALMAGLVEGGGPALAVLSGGNVDPLLLSRLIDHGLSAAGRFCALRLVLDDEPGALHELTGVLARTGANVLSVEHHREGLSLPMARVSVLVTLETRDRDHRDLIVAALTDEGYRVEELR